MTVGAVLVLAGILLVYGAITDQSPVTAIQTVLSGNVTGSSAPGPAEPGTPGTPATVGS